MGLKQRETANTVTANALMLQKLARQKRGVTARRLPELKHSVTILRSLASSETGQAVSESTE